MQAETAPELAVVILSYGPRPSLGDAVRSLLRQDAQAELIVVHSGGGDVSGALGDVGASVRIVTSSQRLLPGGARNLGIASTRATYIAFLADDCIASDGWVRERLNAHRAGASCVASALACHKPRDPVALAAHLSLYFRRMPRTTAQVALRYGASYRRDLFARYGGFDETLESGEDTEFHGRLDAADTPVWRPEIVTIHRGAETVGDFVRSQARRGRRMAEAWRALGTHDPQSVARDAIARTSLILRESWQVVEPRDRATACLGAPLIVCGSVAYALGALRVGRGA